MNPKDIAQLPEKNSEEKTNKNSNLDNSSNDKKSQPKGKQEKIPSQPPKETKKNNKSQSTKNLASSATILNAAYSKKQIEMSKGKKPSKQQQKTSKDIQIQTQPMPKGCMEKLCQCFSRKPNNELKYIDQKNQKKQLQEQELKEQKERDLVKEQAMQKSSDVSRFDNSQTKLNFLSHSKRQNQGSDDFEDFEASNQKKDQNEQKFRNNKQDKDKKNEGQKEPQKGKKEQRKKPGSITNTIQEESQNSLKAQKNEEQYEIKKSLWSILRENVSGITPKSPNNQTPGNNYGRQNSQEYHHHQPHPNNYRPHQGYHSNPHYQNYNPPPQYPPPQYSNGHFHQHQPPYGPPPRNFFGAHHPNQGFTQQLPHFLAQKLAPKFSQPLQPPHKQQSHRQKEYKPRLGYRGKDQELRGEEENDMVESEFYLNDQRKFGLQSQFNKKDKLNQKPTKKQKSLKQESTKALIIDDTQISGNGQYLNSNFTSSLKITSQISQRDKYPNEIFSQQMDNEKRIPSEWNKKMRGQYIHSSISKPILNGLSPQIQKSANLVDQQAQKDDMNLNKPKDYLIIQHGKKEGGRKTSGSPNKSPGSQGNQTASQQNILNTNMVGLSANSLKIQKNGEDPNNKGKKGKGCGCRYLNCATDYCGCKRTGAGKFCTEECGCINCENMPRRQNNQIPQFQSAQQILGGNQQQNIEAEINENINSNFQSGLNYPVDQLQNVQENINEEDGQPPGHPILQQLNNPINQQKNLQPIIKEEEEKPPAHQINESNPNNGMNKSGQKKRDQMGEHISTNESKPGNNSQMSKSNGSQRMRMIDSGNAIIGQKSNQSSRSASSTLRNLLNLVNQDLPDNQETEKKNMVQSGK